MSLIINRKIWILGLGILLLVQTPASAQKARIANITITNTRDALIVYYMNIERAFTEDMGKAILSGVPVTFSFIITLDKARKLWLGKEMTEIRLTHTIKYNNLRKEFVIKRSWEDNAPVVVRTFKEARKLMTELRNIKIVPITLLEKGQKYRVSAKAELSKITLPYYLHHILVFVSLWDFETDWYRIDFVY